MSKWEEETWQQLPTRDTNTYKRMIALAIAERDRHEDISQGFKLCIPLNYLQELSRHFPHYIYAVVGGCFHDREQVYVTWIPLTQRKNH